LSFIVERRQIYVVDLHSEKVRGGLEPWLMARWKARVDFLLTVMELLFLSLTVEVLQGKTCQNSLLFGRVGHFEARFQGKGSSLGNIFLVSRKLGVFCYDSANCTMLRAVVLTQYRSMTQTDGRTDGRMELL